MIKKKLLEHLVDELNTMDLVNENGEGYGINIRFQNPNLTHQDRGVMKIAKYVNDQSGYVTWCGHHKELTKFELLLLVGVVKANHHRVLFF